MPQLKKIASLEAAPPSKVGGTWRYVPVMEELAGALYIFQILRYIFFVHISFPSIR